MAFDDILVDGVDAIDAAKWNEMITNLAAKSVTKHAHSEFNLFPESSYYYIYLLTGTYYAKNMSTGAIDYSGADFSTIMTSVIGDITTTSFIKLGKGEFNVNTAIATGYKAIVIEGSGWGIDNIISNPGTLLMLNADIDGVPLLKFGANGYTVEGAGIRNCAFGNDGYIKPAGAVDLLNTVNCFVDHCYFKDFELGNDVWNPMYAVSIRGDTGETLGGWCNHVTNNHIVNPDIGVLLGANANYCIVQGNNIEASGTALANGIKCDGTGAPIPSPYGCIFSGNRIRNFDYAASRGLWITAGSDNSGRHTIIGNTFAENAINYDITYGTGCGENTFIANVLGAAGSSKGTDNGNIQSYYYNNKNYVREKWGAVSKADGATITHGLETTPTTVIANGSVANEFVSITALGSTTFTVAIKKHDGSAGTTQTVYWRAWI